MPTFTLIQPAVVVGSGGAASIDFTSIPSTYTDLVIKLSVRNTTATTAGNVNLQMRINGGTTGYTGKQIFATTSVGSFSPNNTNIGTITSANDTASTFSNVEVYIPNYAGSTAKSYSVDSVSDTNSSTIFELDLLAKLQSSGTAITSLSFLCNFDNFAQHSTAYLYGVSNA